MNGVNIDSVTDTAPGARRLRIPGAGLAGRCGQPGSATVYGAAGHHRRWRCGLGWLGQGRCCIARTQGPC